MFNRLIRCPHCHKIFKITKTNKIRGYYIFITDFNDVFFPEIDNTYSCISCGEKFDVLQNSIITEDWIANLLFKIKAS